MRYFDANNLPTVSLVLAVLNFTAHSFSTCLCAKLLITGDNVDKNYLKLGQKCSSFGKENMHTCYETIKVFPTL